MPEIVYDRMVKAKAGFAGPKGSHAEGDVFPLPEDVDWLRAGLVAVVEETSETPRMLDKEEEIPPGFTGLQDRGAGWYGVIVQGDLLDKIRDEEDAAARLEGLT